jgi:hypothetical protein
VIERELRRPMGARAGRDEHVLRANLLAGAVDGDGVGVDEVGGAVKRAHLVTLEVLRDARALLGDDGLEAVEEVVDRRLP